MIGYHRVLIGEGGTASCSACMRGSGAPHMFRPVEDIVREVALVGGETPVPDGVLFTGCEPFSHPHLPRIVDAARQAGIERVCLRTDAGALSRSDNARGALAAGVTHIDVVLVADSEDHDRLTGIRGLASACASGVLAFKEAAEATGRRVAVTGRVPLCRHNVHLAAHAVARLAALGAVAVCLDTTHVRPGDLAHVSAALDTAAVNGVHAWADGPSQALSRTSSIAPWREVAVSHP